MDAQEIQDSSSSNLVNVRRLRTAVAMAIIRTARREGSIETGYQMALRMYSAEIRKQQNTVNSSFHMDISISILINHFNISINK